VRVRKHGKRDKVKKRNIILTHKFTAFSLISSL